VLGHDLLLVPRTLVPAVQALIRDQRRLDSVTDDDEGERCKTARFFGIDRQG
jgi:hypothetical protein